MRLGLLTCWVASLLFVANRGVGQEDISVGSKAPAFTLRDQSGKPRSLEELSKDRNVVLVFYRSADW